MCYVLWTILKLPLVKNINRKYSIKTITAEWSKMYDTSKNLNVSMQTMIFYFVTNEYTDMLKGSIIKQQKF